ncbi:mucin-6-like, partial [Diadema antillarum]|uniref:mucin-6-like n=1 Tax=Diadema antillarum TaxID=105358 RepID=UPI003A85D7F7
LVPNTENNCCEGWTGPDCTTAIRCTVPPLSEGLRIVFCGSIEGETVDHNDRCVFSCDEGYSLVGSNTVICSSQSEFNRNMPTCERIQLPENICSIVKGRHYKRLRAEDYDYFPGQCSYYLATIELTSTGSEAVEFIINTVSGENDDDVSITYIALESAEVKARVTLTPNGVFHGNRTATLPLRNTQFSVVERGSYYILRDIHDLRVEYASGERIYLFIPDQFVNEVYGLCATDALLTGGNDISFISRSNALRLQGESCPAVSEALPAIPDSPECRIRFQDASFTRCGLNVTCFENLCANEVGVSRSRAELASNAQESICLAMAEHFRMCALLNPPTVISWRERYGCELTCPSNKEYNERGTVCPRTCEQSFLGESCQTDEVIDGCHCPADTYWNAQNGSCVSRANCFCVHRGSSYANGEEIIIDCSLCTCTGATWDCVRKSNLCGALCSATGSHLNIFRTFDGLIYSINQACEHLLVEPRDDTGYRGLTFNLRLGYNCYLANTACDPYVKLSVITFDNTTETLLFKPDRTVRRDHFFVDLPLILPYGLEVRNMAGNFLLVTADIGLSVKWDWASRLEISASESMKGQIWGLCGIYNGAINDDMTVSTCSPTNDIVEFVNSWLSHPCPGNPELPAYPSGLGLCHVDVQYNARATARCSEMASAEFHPCHGAVDRAIYIQDCMTLACESGAILIEMLERNTCPSFLAYISECARAGVTITWSGYSACGIEECPSGREFLRCPHMVPLSCSHQSGTSPVSQNICHEGCFCANDMIYSDTSDECVAPSDCPCIDEKGNEHKPGAIIEKPCEFCTCVNGTIYCEEVPCRECNYGQVVSQCVCPRTCRNIHSLVCGDDDCEEGCQCPEGQVLDEWNERCVAPKNCPCVMDGTPYAVGVIRKYGSDLCICRAGSTWECASTVDEGSCWAHGISSFITFDDNVFNYDGSCSYMMATDGCSPNTNRTFSVMIESIDCAEGGAFCTKSVHIEFVDITIDLIRGVDPKVRPPEACACVQDIGGRYTLVQHEGVAVQWDGRNMVIVTLKDEYMGRVCGLCGDFDGRSDDDFTKQQGDSTRDVNEFVESWATRECLPSSDMTPACVSEVEEKRRPWAEVMCGTILEGPFVECHQFVNPSRYYEHCVSDSIKCYRGSDCECLCDALAAYAQKCIEKGVCVNWRTEDLCPVPCPCEDHRVYYPCHSSCPTTCWGCADQGECITPKIEGCFCEPGTVERNGTCTPVPTQPTTPGTPITTWFSSTTPQTTTSPATTTGPLGTTLSTTPPSLSSQAPTETLPPATATSQPVGTTFVKTTQPATTGTSERPATTATTTPVVSISLGPQTTTSPATTMGPPRTTLLITSPSLSSQAPTETLPPATATSQPVGTTFVKTTQPATTGTTERPATTATTAPVVSTPPPTTKTLPPLFTTLAPTSQFPTTAATSVQPTFETTPRLTLPPIHTLTPPEHIPPPLKYRTTTPFSPATLFTTITTPSVKPQTTSAAPGTTGLVLVRKFSMGRPGTNPSTALKKDDNLSTCLLDARVGSFSLCLMLVMQPGVLDV